MARGAALECRVDEYVGDAAVLHKQLEVVRARRPLFEEQRAARALHPTGDGGIAWESCWMRVSSRLPSRDGFEDRTREHSGR